MKQAAGRTQLERPGALPAREIEGGAKTLAGSIPLFGVEINLAAQAMKFGLVERFAGVARKRQGVFQQVRALGEFSALRQHPGQDAEVISLIGAAPGGLPVTQTLAQFRQAFVGSAV